jgi:hypothetical protein
LVETVQLDEKLVKGLPEILLIFGATLSTNCVQLINKDDGGLLLSGSREEFTDSLGAWNARLMPGFQECFRRRVLTNTHEDFVEFRSRSEEERLEDN